MYQYEQQKTQLSDIRKQSASEFIHSIGQLLKIAKWITPTYRPLTNGYVEKDNPALTAMLQCHVKDNQQE